MPLRRGRIWLCSRSVPVRHEGHPTGAILPYVLAVVSAVRRAASRVGGGLVPVLALADRVGLRRVVEDQLTVPTDRGAHAGSKVAALVAGMVAGADSIEDMNLLRHGGMGRLFADTYAPSTLGSFLRSFAFGHVRQLDAVAARLVANLAAHTPLLPDAGQIAYTGDSSTPSATFRSTQDQHGTCEFASVHPGLSVAPGCCWRLSVAPGCSGATDHEVQKIRHSRCRREDLIRYVATGFSRVRRAGSCRFCAGRCRW
jgi:hypothetical protein